MLTWPADESIYEKANEFIPERWYSKPDMIKHKDAFAPFSTGPFGCIGKNLALMELRTLTTRIIMEYDVKLAPSEDGRRLLYKTLDHFTVDLGDVDVVFTRA
jgi:cytochrome P450